MQAMSRIKAAKPSLPRSPWQHLLSQLRLESRTTGWPTHRPRSRRRSKLGFQQVAGCHHHPATPTAIRLQAVGSACNACVHGMRNPSTYRHTDGPMGNTEDTGSCHGAAMALLPVAPQRHCPTIVSSSSACNDGAAPQQTESKPADWSTTVNSSQATGVRRTCARNSARRWQAPAL